MGVEGICEGELVGCAREWVLELMKMEEQSDGQEFPLRQEVWLDSSPAVGLGLFPTKGQWVAIKLGEGRVGVGSHLKFLLLSYFQICSQVPTRTAPCPRARTP